MVDPRTMENLLYLSRLGVDDAERREIASHMERILDYFAVLSKYDTAGLSEDLGNAQPVESLREDAVEFGLSVQEVKGFAVKFIDGYFAVPRILDGE